MADVRNLAVLPRPRTAWQAMDAGFTLARMHFISLSVLWLCFAVPVFLLTAAIQYWLGWSLMIFFWWWLKPLYELPIHFYLSRALFSEPIAKKEALKLTFKHFWLLCKTYLTYARFSGKRSMSYGVVFLEKLPLKLRSARIETMTMVTTRHYLLMTVCLHIEVFLTYAVIAIVAYLFFPDIVSQFNWIRFLTSAETAEYDPYFIAASFSSVIAGALVAPFYVAAGFMIYINRRMHLEAWDIEHRFRNITPRTRSALTGTLICLLCVLPGEKAMAEDRAQYLPSKPDVETSVIEVMSSDDFGVMKTRKVPKFNVEKEEQQEEKLDPSFIQWLTDITSSVAGALRILIWGAAILFVSLLIYTLFKFKRPTSKSSHALQRGSRDKEGAKSHPLTQDLPHDIVATAQRFLQQGERRQALSVLFRGALRAIMTEYNLKITSGATESDCQASVSEVANANQTTTFSALMNLWQQEAYANQPQDEQQIKLLIDDWRDAFGGSPRV